MQKFSRQSYRKEKEQKNQRIMR